MSGDGDDFSDSEYRRWLLKYKEDPEAEAGPWDTHIIMLGDRTLLPAELEELDADLLDSLLAKRRAEAEYLRMENDKRNHDSFMRNWR